MITKRQRQKTLRSAPTRTATEPNRGAPGEVDRIGGKYGAGVIYGVSAITRGEALGHEMWIDAEFLDQVAEKLNEGSRKARFKHPGLSSDGLGNTLGKAFSGTVEGDKVVTELHLLESAHYSPEGDLASYVMSFAEESPELFGTSIVFRMDENGTLAHGLENGVEIKGGYPDWKGFKSPDELNTKNLPHARLSQLRAVDVVDEPAANPDGMFSSLSEEGQMIEHFESVMEYALGLSDVIPPESEWLQVSPERMRGFAERFAESRGMEIEFTKQTETMFKKDKGLETQIADLEAQLNKKDSELAAAREQVTALTEAQTAAKAVADVASEADEPAETLEASVRGLTADIKALREEVKSLDSKAEAKAVEKLAEMGHPPVETTEEEDLISDEKSELETYEAMPRGPEKQAYLKANKQKIHAQNSAR